MKVFNLSAEVTISIYTKVEAETIEQAIEIAENRSIERYRWGDKQQSSKAWISDEYDGLPTDIHES